MARDWRWSKASFDGVPFYVDAQQLPGGRRLVVHEYPGAEQHDVEDMGRRAGAFQVTAYFVSETADADSAALRARLDMPGAGLLTIPMFGARRVRAHDWRPHWTQRILNFVGFEITFVEEGSAFAPIPLGLGAAQLGVFGASLATIFGAAIDDALVAAPQASFPRADMLAQAANVVDQVEAVRDATPLPEKTDAAVRVSLADARRAAAADATPGETLASALAALDSVAADATPQGDSIGAIEALDAATADALAARAAILDQWGVSESVTMVPLAAALAFSGQAARLRAIRAYRDRAGAQAARARIAQDAATLTAFYAPLGAEATAAYDDLYGLAAAHLSRRIPDLAPVVLVETGRPLPSNVLAYRLYGDPSRGLELVERNNVATPCMMPLAFEASAK